MFEPYTFIEALGILLCLDVYERCAKMLYGRTDGIQHDLLAVAFAPFGSDDPADGNLRHVSSCRTNTGQSHNLIILRQPQMDSLLVITVQILIDTVLFHHEHIATHSQEFVQLIRGQLPKRLLVKYQFLPVAHLYSLYDTLLLSLFTYIF